MNLSVMNLFGILTAVTLLFFGRKLFWFFVGIAGFLFGSGIAVQHFSFLSPPVSFFIGTACGIICAVIAPFFERILVALAGFITGGYVSVWLFMRLTPLGADGTWIVYLAGGVLGFLLAWVLLDASLIVLSALLGTVLLVENLPFLPLIGQMAALAAFVVGLAVQIKAYKNITNPPSQPKR